MEDLRRARVTFDGKFVEAYMFLRAGGGKDDALALLRIMEVGTERLLEGKAFDAVRNHYADDAWRPMTFMEFQAGCVVGAGLQLCYQEPILVVGIMGSDKNLINTRCPNWRDTESGSESCPRFSIRGEISEAFVSRETGVLLVTVDYPGAGSCWGKYAEYHALAAPALSLR